MAAIKKGDIFYKSWIDLDEGSIEIEEWHITKMTLDTIYLTEKVDGLTWGKRSKTHGDYGFLPNIDSRYHRKKASFDDFGKLGLYRSKAAAYRSTLPELKKQVARMNRLLTRVEKKVQQAKERKNGK